MTTRTKRGHGRPVIVGWLEWAHTPIGWLVLALHLYGLDAWQHDHFADTLWRHALADLGLP